MIIKKTRNSGQFYNFWHSMKNHSMRKSSTAFVNFIPFGHVLENYGDTIILMFPYDIVIGSGFKIYMKEVDFCLVFSI